MTFRKTAIVLSSAASLLGLGACSHKASRDDVAATSRAAARTGASEYASVSFKKGSSELTDAGRRTLREVAQHAESTGKVDEYKVLAWADKEFPEEGQKASRQDIKLADARSEAIKNYLKDDLKTRVDIDEHNMAERPGSLSKLFKTEDYKVKSILEDSSGTAKNEYGSPTMGSKASTALILVDYKNE